MYRLLYQSVPEDVFITFQYICWSHSKIRTDIFPLKEEAKKQQFKSDNLTS